MDQGIQALCSLIFLALLFSLIAVGFAHIVGGKKWSSWMLKTQVKIVRALLGKTHHLGGADCACGWQDDQGQ